MWQTQTQTHQHRAKNMSRTVLKTWDGLTKQHEPANHLIYICLVTNDNSRRKIVLIKIVPTILFLAIQFRPKKDLHIYYPSNADGFTVSSFTLGGAVQGTFPH